MDFECFRLVLRSISRPSTKGFRIVHALNITRSSENHEELVSDRARCGHGNFRETRTHEMTKMLIYSIISFVSGFYFLGVSAATPISVFLLWSFRFDVFLCRRDCFDGKNEITFYDRLPSTWPYSGWCCFDHLTIFVAQNTRRLSISRNAFPVNFYRIRVNKYKHMRVLKNKREIQNYKKLRLIGLFCFKWAFWCNMGVSPRSYKHFTHVGMLQSRYE